MTAHQPRKAAADHVDEDQARTPASGIDQRVFQRGKRAIELLVEARDFAHDLDRNVWDFALEIDTLHRGGLQHSDLRWLVCKGYLEQASELVSGSGQQRCFQRGGALTFTGTSCFILTDRGKRVVQQLNEAMTQQAVAGNACSDGQDSPPTTAASAAAGQPRPCWDRDRQELRVENTVVKQFKVPARNQEVVLAVFHEEGWPARIDDPLPPRPELDSKRRLHGTINSLNRNQKTPLIRFSGDGTGEGVCWEFADRVERLEKRG